MSSFPSHPVSVHVEVIAAPAVQEDTLHGRCTPILACSSSSQRPEWPLPLPSRAPARPSAGTLHWVPLCAMSRTYTMGHRCR
jgi:hypothetical protein